jgi:hypothetical protein
MLMGVGLAPVTVFLAGHIQVVPTCVGCRHDGCLALGQVNVAPPHLTIYDLEPATFLDEDAGVEEHDVARMLFAVVALAATDYATWMQPLGFKRLADCASLRLDASSSEEVIVECIAHIPLILADMLHMLY